MFGIRPLAKVVEQVTTFVTTSKVSATCCGVGRLLLSLLVVASPAATYFTAAT
jgi:hypothetical protein